MKVPTLHQLAKAARLLESDERVPYSFEKRILNHLKLREAADISTTFAKTMWKAALGCIAISLVTGAVIVFAGAPTAELFAGDLERTVLAPVEVEDSW